MTERDAATSALAGPPVNARGEVLGRAALRTDAGQQERRCGRSRRASSTSRG